MIRNFYYINQHIKELAEDVYAQPQDPIHSELAFQVIENWATKLEGCKSVLDIGCGEAFLQPVFEALGIRYLGVCLGEDYLIAKQKGRNVELHDFNFLPYSYNSFDLIFVRHSLEHSVMPLLALMDWHRIAKGWLCLVMPKPKFWTFVGRNHYSVMALSQCRFLLKRAGWDIQWEDHTNPMEYRFLCVKGERTYNHEVEPNLYVTDDLSWIDEDEKDEYEEIVEEEKETENS